MWCRQTGWTVRSLCVWLQLCEDVVVTADGKHMCDGKNFGVLFCSSLGFSVDIPHITA